MPRKNYPRVLNALDMANMRHIEAEEKKRGRKFDYVPGRGAPASRPKVKPTARIVKKSAPAKVVQTVKTDTFGGADASGPLRPEKNIMEMREGINNRHRALMNANFDRASQIGKTSSAPRRDKPVNMGKETAKAAVGAAIGTGAGAAANAAYKVGSYRTGKGDWGIKRYLQMRRDPRFQKTSAKTLYNSLKAAGKSGLIHGAKAALPYAAIGGGAYLAGKYLEKKHPKFGETRERILEDYKKKYGEGNT